MHTMVKMYWMPPFPLGKGSTRSTATCSYGTEMMGLSTIAARRDRLVRSFCNSRSFLSSPTVTVLSLATTCKRLAWSMEVACLVIRYTRCLVRCTICEGLRLANH